MVSSETKLGIHWLEPMTLSDSKSHANLETAFYTYNINLVADSINIVVMLCSGK